MEWVEQKFNFSIIKKKNSEAKKIMTRIFDEICQEELGDLILKKIDEPQKNINFLFHEKDEEENFIVTPIFLKITEQTDENESVAPLFEMFIGSSQPSERFKDQDAAHKFGASIHFSHYGNSFKDILNYVSEYKNIKKYILAIKKYLETLPDCFVPPSKEEMKNIKKIIDETKNIVSLSYASSNQKRKENSVDAVENIVSIGSFSTKLKSTLDGNSLSKLVTPLSDTLLSPHSLASDLASVILIDLDDKGAEKIQLGFSHKSKIEVLLPREKNELLSSIKEASMDFYSNNILYIERDSEIKKEYQSDINHYFINLMNIREEEQMRSVFSSKDKNLIDISYRAEKLFCHILTSTLWGDDICAETANTKKEIPIKIDALGNLVETSMSKEAKALIQRYKDFPNMNMALAKMPLIRAKNMPLAGDFFENITKSPLGGKTKENTDLSNFIKLKNPPFFMYHGQKIPETEEIIKPYGFVRLNQKKHNLNKEIFLPYPNQEIVFAWIVLPGKENDRLRITPIDLQVIRDLATAFLKDVPAADCQEMQELARLNEDDFKKHEMLIINMFFNSNPYVGGKKITFFSNSSFYQYCNFSCFDAHVVCREVNKNILDYFKRVEKHGVLIKAMQEEKRIEKKVVREAPANEKKAEPETFKVLQTEEEAKKVLATVRKIKNFFASFTLKNNDLGVSEQERQQFISDLKLHKQDYFFVTDPIKNICLSLDYSRDIVMPTIKVFIKENGEENILGFVNLSIINTNDKVGNSILYYISQESIDKLYQKTLDFNQNVLQYLNMSENSAIDEICNLFPEKVLEYSSQKTQLGSFAP